MPKTPLILWREGMRTSGLDPDARLVAHTLATYVNSKTLTAHPSVTLLAETSGLNRLTVSRALRRLEAAGWIVISWSRGRSSHRFALAFPRKVP